METQKLTEILENKHFNQFAAILSVAMAPGWRMAHPEVSSVRSALEHRLARLNRGMLKGATNIRNDFIKEWTMLFTQIIEADSRLSYSTDDMDWFIEVLDGDENMARVTFSMLFAAASTRQEWYTLEQIAEFSSKAHSTLRKMAANDEFIGAKLAGKTWIIPALALRVHGISVPSSLKIEEAQVEE